MMTDIDYSVVFQRENYSLGSGTVVHLSKEFLVIEIYDQSRSIRLNEIFKHVEISSGQQNFYEGRGVVCDIADSSSIQLVTLYLVDHFIAVGTIEGEAANEYAASWYTNFCIEDSKLTPNLENELFGFVRFLKQVLGGLQPRITSKDAELDTEAVMNDRLESSQSIAVEKLLSVFIDRYEQLSFRLGHCSEEEKTQIGAFFKDFVFPLSQGSSIFQYFHHAARSTFLNYASYTQIKNAVRENRNCLGRQFLDRFFDSQMRFDDWKRRSSIWMQEIKNWLGENEDKEMRVLLLGSDYLPFEAADQLSDSEQRRLSLEVICFEDETAYDVSTKMAAELAKMGDYEFQLKFSNHTVDSLLGLYFRNKRGSFGSYDKVFATSMLQSLSGKAVAYLIGYFLKLIDHGTLSMFSVSEDYSAVREHWLLWFDRSIDFDECKRSLPQNVKWTSTPTKVGLLTEFAVANKNPGL